MPPDECGIPSVEEMVHQYHVRESTLAAKSAAYPPTSRPSGESHVNQVAALIDSTALLHLHYWIWNTDGNLDRPPSPDAFLALAQLVEAAALYDTLVLIPGWDFGFKYLITLLERMGIVARDRAVAKLYYASRQGPLFEPDAAPRLIATARHLYPTAFEDVNRTQDSSYRDFVYDVSAVAISEEVGLPLIPEATSVPDCVRIRRELTSHEIGIALQEVYRSASSEVDDAARRLSRYSGTLGMTLGPVVLEWMQIANGLGRRPYPEFFESLLLLRERFEPVRKLFGRLQRVLADRGACLADRLEAEARVAEIRSSLQALKDPRGSRVFLLRIADVRQFLPDLEKLAGGIDGILRELGAKQIAWLWRRVRQRQAFQLFSTTDRALHSPDAWAAYRGVFGEEPSQCLVDFLTSHGRRLRAFTAVGGAGTNGAA
jgi:hypothetical protein